MPMVFLGKLAYTQVTILYCCGSILVPYGDLEEQWFDYYVSQLRICLSAERAQSLSQPWVSPLRESDSMTMIFLVNLHMFSSPIYTTTARSHYLMTIARNGSLITLCLSCGFAGQWRILKIFPGPGCLHSENGIV